MSAWKREERRKETHKGREKRLLVRRLLFPTEVNAETINQGARRRGCFARPSARPTPPRPRDGPGKLIGMLGRDATRAAVRSDVMLPV